MPNYDMSVWSVLIVTITLAGLVSYICWQQVIGQSNLSASQENVTTNLAPQQRDASTLGVYVYGGTAFVVLVLAVLRFRFYKSNERAALAIAILIMSLIVWFQSYNIKYKSGGESFAFLMLLPCFWILLGIT